MASKIDEAIEKLALLMTGRLGMPREAQTWDDLGPHAHAAYLDEAKEAVGHVGPIIEQATRMADADALHAHLVGHRQGSGGKCLCGSQDGYTTHAEHVLTTWLASRGIGGWLPRFYRPAGYALHAIPPVDQPVAAGSSSPVEATNA